MRILILFFFLFTSLVQAYEVDNFTGREELKKDSLEILDAEINRILDRALKDTAAEMGTTCSYSKLRQEILRWIRPDPAGQIEMWLEFTNRIDRTRIGIWNSIYQDVNFLDSPIMVVAGIGRSFLLNGVVVGSDKIGHFFMQGLSYYDLVREGVPLEKVLSEKHKEDGLWGMYTSGVKSYADMATNYQGYRFWNSLVRGNNPYFKCERKKGWVRVRKFTWADYVNPAWDEALNCSEMRASIQAKVDLYMKEHGLKCPVDPDKCKQIAQLEYAQYFTSPKCLPK